MPGMSSFEAARVIQKGSPNTRVIYLTMYDDEDYLAEAMQSGAAGYVLKDCPSPQLLAAIRDVYQGGSYLSPRMLSQLVHGFRSRAGKEEPMPRSATLTPREKEVLKLLAEGSSVKEIAAFLGLSIKTVEAHKFNLMRKLNIHNKAHLVQYAIQKKILHMPPAM
jgi:two-component system response regulator NreC